MIYNNTKSTSNQTIALYKNVLRKIALSTTKQCAYYICWLVPSITDIDLLLRKWTSLTWRLDRTREGGDRGTRNKILFEFVDIQNWNIWAIYFWKRLKYLPSQKSQKKVRKYDWQENLCIARFELCGLRCLFQRKHAERNVENEIGIYYRPEIKSCYAMLKKGLKI